MATHEQAVKQAQFRARQERRAFVIHKVRNGQWLFCSSKYWFENRNSPRMKTAFAIYPNGDSHVLHPQDQEPL